MTDNPFSTVPPFSHPLATDTDRLLQHFGEPDGLLPLWIAEPYVDLAPEVVSAVQNRSSGAWYGYETRPSAALDAFWSWMGDRHGWAGSDLSTSVSPSVGTSIGALIELLTEPGQGVILQPPVFTDFKPLVRRAGREPVTNPLVLAGGRYAMDFAGLEEIAADDANALMILCNPHNPVGRVWKVEELTRAAEICAKHDVFVVADEIHADLTLPPNRFRPFATVAAGLGVRWAATHGPIKTFGLAGVCDTLLITDDEEASEGFRAMSGRLHLTRNNVFAVAAFEAAYRSATDWLDGLLSKVAANFDQLAANLPPGVGLVQPEGTYLAWLDLRGLGMDVPELAEWLTVSARLALSPGHWFGRQGAGFARMTVAVAPEIITEATDRLTAAVDAL